MDATGGVARLTLRPRMGLCCCCPSGEAAATPGVGGRGRPVMDPSAGALVFLGSVPVDAADAGSFLPELTEPGLADRMSGVDPFRPPTTLPAPLPVLRGGATGPLAASPLGGRGGRAFLSDESA